MLAIIIINSSAISSLCNSLGPPDTPLVFLPSQMFKTKPGLDWKTEEHLEVITLCCKITSYCPPGRA